MLNTLAETHPIAFRFALCLMLEVALITSTLYAQTYEIGFSFLWALIAIASVIAFEKQRGATLWGVLTFLVSPVALLSPLVPVNRKNDKDMFRRMKAPAIISIVVICGLAGFTDIVVFTDIGFAFAGCIALAAVTVMWEIIDVTEADDRTMELAESLKNMCYLAVVMECVVTGVHGMFEVNWLTFMVIALAGFALIMSAWGVGTAMFVKAKPEDVSMAQ